VDPVTVAVVRPERRDLGVAVDLTGAVRPKSDVEVYTKMPGRAEKVLVEVGQLVEAGTLLAVIEHREMVWQTRQTQAQAAAAQAAVEQAQTNLETTKIQYDRYLGLRRDEAVPQAEFERVEATYRAAQTAVRAAESQRALAQATAGLSREALRSTSITAPIAGTITKRSVDVGTQTTPATSLFQIQDVSSLEVSGAVPARDFVRLRVGQTAKVRVDELPGRTFTGRVTVLSPSLDPRTRRASVKVALGDSGGALLPNMLATISIETGTRAQVLVVPARAVVREGDRAHVFVVKDGHVATVEPSLGEADGELVPVEGGLAESDRVVVSGQDALADGAAVRVAEGAP
jgi:HlyD family secretion protein